MAILSLIGFYLVLFLPTIGSTHLFDWDEINFAEAAREMLVTGNWLDVQIGFEPFWEKPPLFIWLQAISFSVFGVSEFAARLPNVLIGAITLVILFKSVVKRYSAQAAILSVLLFKGSLTPHIYFKSGIIDPLFNLFMFLSVLQFVKAIETQKKALNFLLAGAFLGLAVLAKGPAALLLVGLTGLAYQLIYRNAFYSIKSLLMLLIGLLIPLALYFIPQIVENGWWFMREFIAYQIDLFQNPVASHGQPFYYHAVVLILGCFPLTLLVIPGFVKRFTFKGDQTFVRWMKVLFWIVLILFSLVTTKIIHYSSMCYLPLAAIGGVYLNNHLSRNKIIRPILIVITMAYAGLLAVVTYYGMNLNALVESITGEKKGEFISATSNINGWDVSSTNFSILGYILALALLGAVIVFVIRFKKQNLASYLVANSLLFTLMMFYITPNIEPIIQGSWINHLKMYQGKEMLHFTQGFKSYAHYYYTQHQKVEGIDEIKKEVLSNRGFNSFYELDHEAKTLVYEDLKAYVRDSTDLPFTLSFKIGIENAFPEEAKITEYFSPANKKLKQVFSGSGYVVLRRD